jgi:hypothetical protein
MVKTKITNNMTINSEKNNLKGQERESSLGRNVYAGDGYFTMQQLCSFSHQINQINQIKPNSVLEIGIGSGFTSTILKLAGVDVWTADINASLSPDIVSSISELPNKLSNRRFDLVVCCEVLEHMPFSEFSKSLEIFKLYSNCLYLTLPSYATWFGFSGFMRLPKLNKLINVGMYVNKKKDLANAVHYWEIGSTEETSRDNLNVLLTRQYNNVEHGVYQLNRYHEYFVCKD